MTVAKAGTQCECEAGGTGWVGIGGEDDEDDKVEGGRWYLWLQGYSVSGGGKIGGISGEEGRRGCCSIWGGASSVNRREL